MHHDADGGRRRRERHTRAAHRRTRRPLAAGVPRTVARRPARLGVEGLNPSGFDVVGVGANAVDLICRLPAYPQPSSPFSKLRIQDHQRSPGGQTATALSACAALGLRTAYVGTIGRDADGALVAQALAERGVDARFAIARDARNAFAVILVAEPNGERIVLWDRDPALTLRPDDLPRDLLTRARLVHVEDVDVDAAIAAAAIAREAGAIVTSDIEAVGDRTSALVAAVSVPIFAEDVPIALTGERSPEAALRALRPTHAGLLCVTLGVEGAVLLDGDTLVRQPAFHVETVDTTGAGDVFRAGLIAAMLRGEPPAAMLRFANAAAALSCTRHGAIPSVPTLGEVEAFLQSAPRQP